MLIDRTHTRWAIVTLLLALAALALRAWLGWNRPGGLTGGTTAGLWFGVAGSALMLFAGALSAHRRLGVLTWLPIRRWLGSRQSWLRAHIWLGSLSAVLIYCHAGPRLGGPLEMALWVVLAITIVSGFFGLAMQSVLPRRITQRIQAEAPYEQIPHLCLRMRQESDGILETALAVPDLAAPLASELRTLHERVRGFLGERIDSRSPLVDAWRAEPLFARVRQLDGMSAVAEPIDRLERLCDERRQLAEQARLHRWLHFWLLIHIPVTVALLVLGAVHAVMSVYW